MYNLNELLPLNQKHFEPFSVINIDDNKEYSFHLAMSDDQAVVFDIWERKTKLVDSCKQIWRLKDEKISKHTKN